MKTEDVIAGMCLYGFIRKEKPAEQARYYGKAVARIVEGFMKKG